MSHVDSDTLADIDSRRPRAQFASVPARKHDPFRDSGSSDDEEWEEEDIPAKRSLPSTISKDETAGQAELENRALKVLIARELSRNKRLISARASSHANRKESTSSPPPVETTTSLQDRAYSGFDAANRQERKSVDDSIPQNDGSLGYIYVACPGPPGALPKRWPRLDNFKAHIARKHKNTDQVSLITACV